MKKFMLLPESKYVQLMNNVSETDNKNILQAIKEPVQQEMIRKYDMAQNMLSNIAKPNELQMDEYKAAMKDFTTLRDQSRYDAVPRVMEDKVTANAIQSMPTTLQSNTKMLMNRLQEEDDNIISWSDNGEVSIHGQRLPGTNISDLVSDVIRSTKTELPERKQFLKVLAELNTPETLIRNKTAMEQYRRIKNKHPPGIPQYSVDTPTKKRKRTAVSWTVTK